MKPRTPMIFAAMLLAGMTTVDARMPRSAGASGITPPSGDWNETVVLVRHGEKPTEHPMGNINCQGLNRALALPGVLAHFGRPAAIYAPNPATLTNEGDPFGPKYSYIRPLMTIEPYAISLGMPVNAGIATNDLNGLQAEMFKPQYSHALIMIAWEHVQAWKFAELELSSNGLNPELAPHWENSDYDTIYIFHFFTGPDGKRKLEFKVDAEHLNGKLANTCPTPQMLQ
jgi:hypothetical protein